MAEVKIYRVFEGFVEDILHRRTGYELTSRLPPGASVTIGEPSEMPDDLGDVVCVGEADNARPILAVKVRK